MQCSTRSEPGSIRGEGLAELRRRLAEQYDRPAPGDGRLGQSAEVVVLVAAAEQQHDRPVIEGGEGLEHGVGVRGLGIVEVLDATGATGRFEPVLHGSERAQPRRERGERHARRDRRGAGRKGVGDVVLAPYRQLGNGQSTGSVPPACRA